MSLHDDQERLNEAWRDLAFTILDAIGIIWLAERLGMKPKPWVRERQIRKRHQP